VHIVDVYYRNMQFVGLRYVIILQCTAQRT